MHSMPSNAKTGCIGCLRLFVVIVVLPGLLVAWVAPSIPLRPPPAPQGLLVSLYLDRKIPVIPAKAGIYVARPQHIYRYQVPLDSRFRGNDVEN